MSDLKKEYKEFMQDIEKNVTNQEDLKFIKERVSDLFNVVLEEVESIANYKEEKINILMKKQQELEVKMEKMQEKVTNIEKDIYIEDEDEDYDIEIVCPYCNNEFVIDLEEDRTEITCPECNNVIELDWSGDVEEGGCSSSGCSHCHGCAPENEEEDDM